MVTAIVLLKVLQDRVHAIGGELCEMAGVSEVYSVAGGYDLVAVVRASDNDCLEELITGHMLKVDGIQESETLVAVQVFSRHDLEAMFAIGIER